MALLLGACERIFTVAPISFLQRNPANLDSDQQIAYARDALAAGDTEAMLAAYDLLRTTDDPETQILVADLALGIAGISSLTVRFIAGIDMEPVVRTSMLLTSMRPGILFGRTHMAAPETRLAIPL